MNVSIGAHWEQFVDGLVRSGRYGSASEVVRDGLRHLEVQEAKLKALKDDIEESIARGGSHRADEVRAHIRKLADEMEQQKTAAE